LWATVLKGGAAFNLTSPNLVFLDVAAQQQLAAQYADFIALLPCKHFGRNNIGHLLSACLVAH
jgi:hypothetical protein